MDRICGRCFQESLNEQGICTQCGFDQGANQKDYPMALPPGSILCGRYIIGRVLGQGGFGITYVAKDYQTGQIVAIKEFFPDTMATRTDKTTVMPFAGERGENFGYGRQTFLNEAQTMAEFIGNPNIVRVYSYFEENGTGYFVMEYVSGDSLQNHIRSSGGRLSWEHATEVLFPVMDALSVVHSKGIIHRDVAPDNICLSEDGTVKLLDFGAARYSLGNVSRSLDVVLRHGFAPKEQYKRHGRQGSYTDVYAMGATLYYALTGVRPDDAIERMDEDSLPLPSTLGARVTEAQEDVILKAMAVQPENRYQSMAEFKAALLAAQSAPGPKRWEQKIPEAGSPEKKTEKKPAGEKRKLPKAVIGIAAAAAIAVGGFLLVESSYKAAGDLMAQGQYEEAAQSFSRLSFYRDSQQMQQKAVFAQSEELLKQRQYDLALEKLAEIPDYEKTETQIKEVRYQWAESYLSSKKYSKAYTSFGEIAGYRDAEAKRSSAAMTWAKSILDSCNPTESNMFRSTVKNLSDADKQALYDCIANANYRTYTDIAVVENMLSCIQNDVPDAKVLKEALANYNSDTFILDNREKLEALWDVPYVRKVVQDDYHITHWLRGNWKSAEGKNIKFYNKEGSSSITSTSCSYNLPYPEEPKGTAYYDVINMEWVWTDEDDNVLVKVYRFELTDNVDKMKVYCFKNQRTYTVTRS